MRLSVFTKLFLIHIIFIIIPIIIVGFLIVSSYEQIVNNLFQGEDRIIYSFITQALYSTLTEIKIQIIITIILVIFLSLVGGILINKIITGRLRKIVKATEEISQGNFDFKIKTKTKDEIGSLAENFNAMAEELKSNKKELEKARQDLERKVNQRTLELKKAINNREIAINNRTKELQDKIKELETIHRLSVGRELKMMELKKEIKLLKNKKPTKTKGKK